MSGREDGAAPTPSAESASSRTGSARAKGVGQPRAGCSAHHGTRLKDSQVLRSSDQAPECSLGMLEMLGLCIPTQGQGAASASLHNPSATFFQANCNLDKSRCFI